MGTDGANVTDHGRERSRTRRSSTRLSRAVTLGPVWHKCSQADDDTHLGTKLGGELAFLPERILDDCLRGREPVHTVPDDLNAFTIVMLRTLLARSATDPEREAEREMLEQLGAECPNELWANRQAVRDRIRTVADEVEEGRAAGLPGIAPYVRGLRDMMDVNEEQRWELQARRGRLNQDRDKEGPGSAGGEYAKYLEALDGMLPEEVGVRRS